jgi:AraC-like DNA-binding protein
MANGGECCDHSPRLPASGQLGVGHYIGRTARSAALPHCHLSTVVHGAPRQLPDHAHDWPYLGMLLRGSYVSRTRTRELEFRQGVAVYHPRAFQHCDEIGRDGGLFFGVQLSPVLLDGADRVSRDAGRDVAVLDDDGTYIVLGALFAALCADADPFSLEALAAELAGGLMRVTPPGGAMPLWLKRTEQRLRDEPAVSLQDLSQDAGVHVTTLTRLFRRHKNCSLGDYRARARARRAFFAVVGSAAPLADLCHDAGYADQSHMTREFRRAFAISPGRLRLRATGQAKRE